MTYSDDDIPKPKSNNGKTVGLIILAIIGFGAFVYFAYNLYSASSSDLEPRINSNFTDSNQTRAELLKIIENQRQAVYSSYPLEWAFCQDKLEGNIVNAERSDIRVKNNLITQSIHCENEAGVKVVYDLKFNQITKDYEESMRFPGV